MSLASLENLEHYLSVSTKLHIPSTQSNSAYLHYVTKKLEWDAIKELIVDLGYNNELGFLSSKEVDLYEKLASAYAEVLLPTNCDYLLESASLELDSNQTVLFHSRIEDKLMEKQERFQNKEANKQNLSQLCTKRNDLLMELVRLQFDLAETISQICTTTSELFREVRRNAQTKMNLLISTVLLTEAEGLRSQVSSLSHSIMEEARKNVGLVTHLQQTRTHLLQTSMNLEKEVNDLERILRIYQSQDDEYQELVRRYCECQRQLALRSNLLNEPHSASGTSNCHSACLHGRRSLSLDNLPRAKNTLEDSIH